MFVSTVWEKPRKLKFEYVPQPYLNMHQPYSNMYPNYSRRLNWLMVSNLFEYLKHIQFCLGDNSSSNSNMLPIILD